MSGAVVRAVGYRRVSMREQVDGHSLDAQEVNIRQYADSHQWHLVEIYTDAGISAKKGSHRPALERLMADAQAGRFEIVIVDKIDRFYRHLSGLLSALDKLNTWNVSFVSVQEQLDFTTVWGKLTLTVLGILAEIYLDNLRQETRKGKLQRARKGLWNGNIPFGYCRGNCLTCNIPNGKDYCPDFGKTDKTENPDELVFHPVEKVIVR
ncbi:MAG: recombinase family protein, partial [Gammaproteobacteria bacterium]